MMLQLRGRAREKGEVGVYLADSRLMIGLRSGGVNIRK